MSLAEDQTCAAMPLPTPSCGLNGGLGEHRDGSSAEGLADPQAFEERRTGWLCVIGKKPSGIPVVRLLRREESPRAQLTGNDKSRSSTETVRGQLRDRVKCARRGGAPASGRSTGHPWHHERCDCAQDRKDTDRQEGGPECFRLL